jgi:hypothetical protein
LKPKHKRYEAKQKTKRKRTRKKGKNLSHLGRPEVAAQEHPGNPSLLFPSVSFFSLIDGTHWSDPPSTLAVTPHWKLSPSIPPLSLSI